MPAHPPSLEDTLIAACNLARDYWTQNKSPCDLLLDSGYLHHGNEITEEMILDHVRAHRDLIADWLAYSINKRVSSGWYFSAEVATGPFVVGYSPGHSPGRASMRQFEDGAEACALYIKCELEGTASSARAIPRAREH